MYQIRDAEGFVGDFTTVSGLKYFREHIPKNNLNILRFIEKGSSLITEELLSELYSLKSSNTDLQKIIERLQDIAENSDTVLILNLE